MRKGFKAFTLVGTVAMALAISVSATLACTSIVLPPGSTVDGSSMTTHNADSGSTPYELTKIPAAKYEAWNDGRRSIYSSDDRRNSDVEG